MRMKAWCGHCQKDVTWTATARVVLRFQWLMFRCDECGVHRMP